MPKIAQLHSGVQLAFPDETPDEVVDSVVKQHADSDPLNVLANTLGQLGPIMIQLLAASQQNHLALMKQIEKLETTVQEATVHIAAIMAAPVRIDRDNEGAITTVTKEV